MEKLRIKKRDIPIIMFCVGIFAFPYILRERILGSLALINLGVYFGMFYGGWRKILILPTNYKKDLLNFILWCSYSVVAIFLLFYVKGNEWSTVRRFLLLFVYIFPAIILCTKISNRDRIEYYSRVWLKVIRIICRLMCVCWIIDKLLGNSVQRLWASLYQSSTLLALTNHGRFVSFYGHSLENTAFFLMLLVWTTICKDELQKHNKVYVLDVLTALFGIAICGSKSGLMLAILLLLLCNIGLKKAKYMIAILIVCAGLYVIGAFDLIISRVMEGIAAGDLTTARNSSLETLMLKGIVDFKMLEGHPFKYNDVAMVAALEYPFLEWSFVCGILFTIVQYLMYFIKPSIQVLRTKKWSLFICLLILMAFYNGNNGIVSFNDDLLIFTINVWLITQLAGSKCEREKNEKKNKGYAYDLVNGRWRGSTGNN